MSPVARSEENLARALHQSTRSLRKARGVDENGILCTSIHPCTAHRISDKMKILLAQHLWPTTRRDALACRPHVLSFRKKGQLRMSIAGRIVCSLPGGESVQSLVPASSTFIAGPWLCSGAPDRVGPEYSLIKTAVKGEHNRRVSPR